MVFISVKDRAGGTGICGFRTSTHEVLKVTPDGSRSHVATVLEHPSGLGWLPDGSMLIVSMKDRKLMRLADGNLTEHADMSSIATWHCNDMVVSADGRAYVGNFGYDHYSEPEEKTANLVRVDPDGSVHLAESGLKFQTAINHTGQEDFGGG